MTRKPKINRETLSTDWKCSPLELSIVCRHPKTFFAISLVIALSFMVFNLYVKTVDNVDYFTIENDPDIAFYDGFKELFGNDEFFVIAVKSEDLFSKQKLETTGSKPLLVALKSGFSSLSPGP